MRISLFCLTVSLLITCCIKVASAQFEYIFPSNGDKNNLPNTHLILRNGELMDPASITTDKVVITGSKSGNVPVAINLSTDGKTVCIAPAVAFAYQENVHVEVKDGLKTLSGKELKGTSFDFSIRRKMTDEENAKVQEYLNTHDDDGNLINDPNRQSVYVPYDHAATRSSALRYVLIYTDNNPAPGEIFFNRNSGTLPVNSAELGYGIIEPNGDSVFYRAVIGDGINFHVNYDGYMTALRLKANIDTGVFMLDSSYNEIREVHCKDGLFPSQHEHMFFPDGTKWFTIYDYVPTDLTAYGGGDNTPMNYCWIQELDANDNVIFEWRADRFFLPNEATSDIFPTTINGTTYDPWHLNSMYLDNDGNLMASFRNMDRIVKINRATGLIMWQWCGKGATIPGDFITTGEPPTGLFSHMHHVHRIENGHILMFDNGNLQSSDPSQNISRPKEYVLDEVNHTAQLVWFYDHPQVQGFNMYTTNQGSAFRLPNGNTIIGYGLPRIQGLPNGTEIDANKNIVWEFRFKDSTVYSYRVYKIVWDPNVGIANLNKDVIKLQVFPNPSNGIIHLNLEAPPSSKNIVITVSNILGQTVYSRSENYQNGNQLYSIDLTDREKGFYIIKVEAGGKTFAGNIMLE